MLKLDEKMHMQALFSANIRLSKCLDHAVFGPIEGRSKKIWHISCGKLLMLCATMFGLLLYNVLSNTTLIDEGNDWIYDDVKLFSAFLA